MISSTMQIIQQEFQDNWVGDVHFEGNQFEAISESWIHLDVVPIYVETVSYGGCVSEVYGLYITAYHRNPTQAASLADQVIAFIQHRLVGDVTVGTWSPLSKGTIESGKSFLKFRLPLTIIN